MPVHFDDLILMTHLYLLDNMLGDGNLLKCHRLRKFMQVVDVLNFTTELDTVKYQIMTTINMMQITSHTL